MKPRARTVLADAHLAWVQGADETRKYSDFAEYAVAMLAAWGYRIEDAA